MENSSNRCGRCGNFLSESEFCYLACAEKEIKEIGKFFLVSSLLGTLFALAFSLFAGGPSTFVDWVSYILIFTLAFGRRNSSGSMRASQCTMPWAGAQGPLFSFFNRSDLSKKTSLAEISFTLKGFISYIGPLNLFYNLFRLLKLLRIRREISYNENRI